MSYCVTTKGLGLLIGMRYQESRFRVLGSLSLGYVTRPLVRVAHVLLRYHEGFRVTHWDAVPGIEF